jgi:cyclopropane fatty-acyl-phospholipid synthase-like methyltransferase
MADKADINVLYEQSVQCVESEIDFVDEIFQKLRGRKAALLREDFCGTANTSCEWISRRKTNKAIAVDLNEEVLAWGREHKVSKLTDEQAMRITLINDNVINVDTGEIDMALAMNFSYWIFEDRPTMIKYFKGIHDTLVDDGILFLDAFGGYEAYQEMKERTEHDKFTYVWDQASYDPVTGHCVCHIHFKFKDGSKINKAFTYEWRLWGLPELTEMLTEAGFKATVYWEGTDEDTDEGNGIFVPATEGEADAGWIAYIVAEK